MKKTSPDRRISRESLQQVPRDSNVSNSRPSTGRSAPPSAPVITDSSVLSEGRNGVGSYAPHALLKLDKILGSCISSSSLMCASATGDIFYPAGLTTVRYSLEDNTQKSFLQGSDNAISCYAITNDGKYLCVAERGDRPTATIWNIFTNEKVSVLSTHKGGISCVAFSPDSKFLVTVGFKADRQVIVWDWKNRTPLFTLKSANKVYKVAFHPSGAYFVTCGDRHFKWWNLKFGSSGRLEEVNGKPASINEERQDFVYLDLKFANDASNHNVYAITSKAILCMFSYETKLMTNCQQIEAPAAYALDFISSNSSLFGGSKTKSNNAAIVVGCSDGLLAVFDSSPSLNYICTLPLPSALANIDVLRYPACYALSFIPSSMLSPVPKLAVAYADFSLYIWDISDIFKVIKFRSFSYHFGCIRDIQFIDNNSSSISSSSHQGPLPPGSFATCSSDNTIRFWNTDAKNQKKSRWKSPHSKEMLHMLELQSNDADVTGSVGALGIKVNSSIASTASNSSFGTANGGQHSRPSLDLSSGIPDFEIPDQYEGQMGPRAIAVHPQGSELCCGDRLGYIRVFDLRTMLEKFNIYAHAGDIYSMSYSPNLLKSPDDAAVETEYSAHSIVLLATAGKDRLIHIFNATDSYSFIRTLSHHSSTITDLRFSFDGSKLLSCDGGKSLSFCVVKTAVGEDGSDSNIGCNIDVQNVKTVNTRCHIRGIAIEATNKFAFTCGNGSTSANSNSSFHSRHDDQSTGNNSNSTMSIWNLQQAKMVRNYRCDVRGEMDRCDIDPSGTYVAVICHNSHSSSNDNNKSIYSEIEGGDSSNDVKKATSSCLLLFDFFSGDLVANVAVPSTNMTTIKFSPDGRHLIVGGSTSRVSSDTAADAGLNPNNLESDRGAAGHSGGLIAIYNIDEKLIKVMRDRLQEIVLKMNQKQGKIGRIVKSFNENVNNTVISSIGNASGIEDNHVFLNVGPDASNISASFMSNGSNLTDVARGDRNKDKYLGNASNKPNKWSNLVSESESYEIFGKKIALANADIEKNRNKFTLEFTGTVGDVSNLKSPNKSKTQQHLASTVEDSDNVNCSWESDDDSKQNKNVNNITIVNSNIDDTSNTVEKSGLGEETENDNNVSLLFSDSDEDDNDARLKKLFAGRDENSSELNGKASRKKELLENDVSADPDYSSDFDESAFDEAKSKIENMEKSANHLESWLEDILRKETEGGDGAMKDDGAGEDRNASILSQSLSSKFFNNLRLSQKLGASSSDQLGSSNTAASANGNVASNIDASSMDSASQLNSSQSSVKSNKTELNKKRRETLTALAVMKDRLKSMGIIDSSAKDGADCNTEYAMFSNMLEKEKDAFDNSNPLLPEPPSGSGLSVSINDSSNHAKSISSENSNVDVGENTAVNQTDNVTDAAPLMPPAPPPRKLASGIDKGKQKEDAVLSQPTLGSPTKQSAAVDEISSANGDKTNLDVQHSDSDNDDDVNDDETVDDDVPEMRLQNETDTNIVDLGHKVDSDEDEIHVNNDLETNSMINNVSDSRDSIILDGNSTNRDSKASTSLLSSSADLVSSTTAVNSIKLSEMSEKCRIALMELDRAKETAFNAIQNFVLTASMQASGTISADGNVSSSAFYTSPSKSNITTLAEGTSSSNFGRNLGNPTLIETAAYDSSLDNTIRHETESILSHFRRSVSSLNEIGRVIEQGLIETVQGGGSVHGSKIFSEESFANLPKSVFNGHQNRSDDQSRNMESKNLTSQNLTFNRSAMMETTGVGNTRASSMVLSGTSMSDLDLSNILEKYSDKLVDLIADKVKKQIDGGNSNGNSNINGSSSSSSPFK